MWIELLLYHCFLIVTVSAKKLVTYKILKEGGEGYRLVKLSNKLVIGHARHRFRMIVEERCGCVGLVKKYEEV